MNMKMNLGAAIRFHWADYLTLLMTLLLSCGIGVYYGIVGRKKSTSEEYFMASRSMHVLPVSFSLFVSWLSAVSFLSDPVEVYYYGSVYWVFGIGYCIGLPIAAQIFAPVLYRMKLTSVFEYLEIRYNVQIRIVCSIASGVGMMLYMSVVLYAPSLALSQVSGLDVWVSIVIVGAVCTFYTTLGGMKAVLWADTMQFFIMLSGFLAIFVQGSILLGGLSNIWNICQQGGRINFFRFSPSPLKRSTVWTFLIGGLFRTLNPYISGQIWVQRYCTLKSLKDVKLSIYLNVPLYILFVTLFTSSGLILFAFYNGCDPLKEGRVEKPDQMIPLLVLELFRSFPGVSGLFLGSLFSASLSTLSSGQNGLAANCLGDVIQPVFARYNNGKQIPDRLRTILAKILSFLLGVICVIMALLLILTSGSTIFQLSMAFVNSILAPISGLYFVGILFPSVDSFCVVCGSIISLVVSCWLTIGTLIHGAYHTRLPNGIDNCNLTSFNTNVMMFNPNIISSNMTHELYSSTERSWLEEESVGWNDTTTIQSSLYVSLVDRYKFSDAYLFSPILYPAVGPVVSIVATLLISFFIGSARKINGRRKEKKKLNEKKLEDKEIETIESSHVRIASL